MRICAKCNKEGYSPEVEMVRMAGGYRVFLCISCRNNFEEYLRPELQHMAGLEACLSAAAWGGNLKTATDYAERINKETIRLYVLSKKWTKGELT